MTKTDQDREAVAYMGKSIADMVIEWVDNVNGLGWRVGLQKMIELRLSRLLKERDTNMRARAASAPQVPDGWVLVPRWPTYEQMAKMAVEWGYTVEEAGGVYDVILDVCGKDAAHPAPVASHEPASVSEEVGRLRKAYADAADAASEYILRIGNYACETDAQGVRDAIHDRAAISAPPPEPAKAEVVDGPFQPSQLWYDDATMCLSFGAEKSEPRQVRYVRADLPTPPTAPAAARSAAGERERLGKLIEDLTRPIPCIDGMTAYEVFETMGDRIAAALPLPGEEA